MCLSCLIVKPDVTCMSCQLRNSSVTQHNEFKFCPRLKNIHTTTSDTVNPFSGNGISATLNSVCVVIQSQDTKQLDTFKSGQILQSEDKIQVLALLIAAGRALQNEGRVYRGGMGQL